MTLSLVEYCPKIKNFNGCNSSGALVSIWDEGYKTIGLVIGSDKEYATACFFYKESLQELIKALQEVEEVME